MNHCITEILQLPRIRSTDLYILDLYVLVLAVDRVTGSEKTVHLQGHSKSWNYQTVHVLESMYHFYFYKQSGLFS